MYLACSPTVYPDLPACTSKYIDASPRTWYTNPSLPHTFFANGGGPDPSHPPELISLQSALDFDTTLKAMGWINGNQYVECIVDNTHHGRGLRFDTCDDHVSGTVWWRTASFLG